MIVATAGHVDHGKTALVKALTGKDTDRLPEEKARGLSIDLGFAYQSLPDSTNLGFVDVPGHEKFIRNMLAGVGGIDLGLLVVAADDGVMPQTLEHFAILDLLGIDKCIVAISKIDRVDDDRILEVQQQVETLLGDAGHEDITVYPVCAPDNEGVDALRHALHECARRGNRHLTDGYFRMAIDRAFSLRGVGLVVTGMVFAGEVGIDEKLLLSGDASQLRVRGIRAHDQVSNRARAGERCAINVAGRGVSENSVRRGDWLMDPRLYAPSRRIDVDLRVLYSESRPLKHWAPTHLHIGADRIATRVAVLRGGSIAAGERGLAQLVLEEDAFSVHGDRFVLRDQSAQRTIAGGQVIDPCSPRRGRARPTRIATLEAMNRRDAHDVLAALTEVSEKGVKVEPFAISLNLPGPRIDAIIESLSLQRVGSHQGEWAFAKNRWQQLLDKIELALGEFHESRPELPGAGLRDIQLALNPFIETPILEAAMASLIDKKRLDRRAARFHLPAHQVRVSQQDRQLWARATPMLAPQSGSPMSLHQVAEALGVDKRTLEISMKNAVKIGEMALLAKNRYVPVWYLAQLAGAAEVLARESADGNFTVAGYCEQTKTGRNFAIGLLEYFDRVGFTERSGNHRRIKQPAATVFASADEAARGRGSHPGGAPGLQIR